MQSKTLKLKEVSEMASYDVHVFCDECSGVHPMGVRIQLNDGPADKQSVGDTYRGKSVPTTVANFIHNYVTCQKTGKLFVQQDNNQIFLVPVGD